MGYDCIELKTVRLFGLRKGGDMMRRKSLMSIVLMVSGTGLHGMMCVQTKDMPVILPKTFVEASPILRTIQKERMLQDLNKRGLFDDQNSDVVLRVVQDQAELTSREPVKDGRLIGYRGYEHMALYISLARRLQLNALLAEYRKIIKSSRN
jgi:hypothetical protein